MRKARTAPNGPTARAGRAPRSSPVVTVPPACCTAARLGRGASSTPSRQATTPAPGAPKARATKAAAPGARRAEGRAAQGGPPAASARPPTDDAGQQPEAGEDQREDAVVGHQQ